MKLESQVCSLELAKKLKELGVKQESLFYWKCCMPACVETWKLEQGSNGYGWSIYSAFTVAELLDIAPASTSMLKRTDIKTKKIPRYYVETFNHYRDKDYDENPADALAKMLIYFLENKLNPSIL